MQNHSFVLSLLLGIAANFATAQTNAPGLALSGTPSAVQQTIRSNLSGGKSVTKIERAVDDGDVSYDVETQSPNGEEWDLSVAEDGTLLSTDITPDQLPPEVRTVLQDQIGPARLDGIEKLIDDGETTYRAEIADPTGNDLGFTLAPDGTLLSQEINLTELPLPVQTAINSQLGQDRLEGVEKNFDHGDITYQATVIGPTGEERDYDFAEDGTLASQEVRLRELPRALQTVVIMKKGRSRLDGIDKNFDDDGVSYDISITTPAGQHRDFSISDRGELLSQQVSLQETSPPVQQAILGAIGDGAVIHIDRAFVGRRFHYEIEAQKNGKPFDFMVGPKGHILN